MTEKFETKIRVNEGGTPYKIRPDNDLSSGKPDWVDWEQAIRNTGARGGSNRDITIALDSICAPGAIDRVLETIREGQFFPGDHTIRLDPEVIRVHGRTAAIKDKRRRTLPSDIDIARVLLTGWQLDVIAVCDQFMVYRASMGGEHDAPGWDVLYVRLFTAGQQEANDAAHNFDHLLNAQLPWLSHMGGMLYNELDVDSVEPAKAARPPKREKKRKRPAGNALLVLQYMEQEQPVGAPSIDDVFDEMGEQIESPRSGRRREYFDSAVSQLVAKKWLRRENDCLTLI